MIYWHVEEVGLILTSWHQCCDTFLPQMIPWTLTHFQRSLIFEWGLIIKFKTIFREPLSSGSVVALLPHVPQSPDRPFPHHQPPTPRHNHPFKGLEVLLLIFRFHQKIRSMIMIRSMFTKLMSNISSDDPRPPTSDTQLRFDRRSAIWLGLRRADEKPLWPDESVADLWVKYRWFETVTFASKISLLYMYLYWLHHILFVLPVLKLWVWLMFGKC